jgi:hypothetical protein
MSSQINRYVSPTESLLKPFAKHSAEIVRRRLSMAGLYWGHCGRLVLDGGETI